MTVTKDDLKHYQDNEIALLQIDEELKDAYNTYRSPSLSNNGVKPSNPSASSPQERALRTIGRLEKKRDYFLKKQEEVKDYVFSIDDPLIFMICNYHFLKGYTWEATSVQLKSCRSKSVLIDKVNRYFTEHGLE